MEQTKQTVTCEKCGKECKNLGSHMRFCPGKKDETKPTDTMSQPTGTVVPSTQPPARGVILLTPSGKEVPNGEYFFKDVVPPGFSGTCGKPVDREDMVAVFNRVFKPEHNFLFYKALDKEVYIVIPPIKYSTTIGEQHNSLDGDFQKHAISFINEGSVNLDTLKIKLERIVKFCKFDN